MHLKATLGNRKYILLLLIWQTGLPTVLKKIIINMSNFEF